MNPQLADKLNHLLITGEPPKWSTGSKTADLNIERRTYYAQLLMWESVIESNTLPPGEPVCCVCRYCGHRHADCRCKILEYAVKQVVELEEYGRQHAYLLA